MAEKRNRDLSLKNCWKDESIARAIHLWLREYIVALSIGYTVRDNEQEGCGAFFTGFLWFCHNQFMWITAGHILEEVEKIINSNSTNIHSVAWNDNDGVGGINKIPVEYGRLHKYKLVNNSYDIGVILFKEGDLELKNIRNNTNNKWFVWEDNNLLKSNGFYLIGFPEEVARSKTIIL